MKHAYVYAHICMCITYEYSRVRDSKVDDSLSDDEHSIETVLYAVSINPLLPVPTPFSLLSTMFSTFNKVGPSRLVFTGKTDIYRFILACKAPEELSTSCREDRHEQEREKVIEKERSL